MLNLQFNKLDKSQQGLLESAESALNNSYSPYSNYRVGAAILTKDKNIITGSNVENAVNSSSICAERSALAKAYSEGYRDITSIAIIGKHKDNNEVISPCGECRQMIYEMSVISKNDIEIIMSDSNKEKIIITSISELLPLPFGPKNIK